MLSPVVENLTLELYSGLHRDWVSQKYGSFEGLSGGCIGTLCGYYVDTNRHIIRSCRFKDFQELGVPFGRSGYKMDYGLWT